MPPGRAAVHAARPGQASHSRSARGSRRARGAVDARGARGTATAPWCPTPIQRWFFEQPFANPHHWNQAFLFEVRADVDVDVLEQALGHVVARHDALRLRMAGNSPEWTLTYDPSAPAPVDRADRSRPDGASTSERPPSRPAAVTAQAGLDLERGPLLAAVHSTSARRPGRLLLAIHHLAVDGVSWRVLIEDLEAAYLASRPALRWSCLPRSASFRRWSQALTDYASTAEPGNSLDALAEIDAVDGTLPTDGSEPGENTEATARTATVSLDATRPEPCSSSVPAAYRTQINDVLLAALALALRAWTGREAHRIDLEGHGREEWIGTARRVAHGRLVHDASIPWRSISRASQTKARR